MGRNHFQQQHCADGSMWMESQGQQQSYAFQEESWSPDNNYGHNHKQFPGMHMNMNNNNNNKRLGAFAAVDSDFSMQKHHHGHGNGVGAMHMNMNRHGGKLGGMFQEGMHSDHHGGRKFPFGGHHHGNNNASQHHFPNHGGHHEYFSEESEEYEESYAEEHVGGVTAKVDEMRHERHNWGGGDTRYANPYGMNMNHKPHKFQWTAKGSKSLVRTCSNRKERRVFKKEFPGSKKYLRSTKLRQERGLRAIGQFELVYGRVEVEAARVLDLASGKSVPHLTEFKTRTRMARPPPSNRNNDLPNMEGQPTQTSVSNANINSGIGAIPDQTVGTISSTALTVMNQTGVTSPMTNMTLASSTTSASAFAPWNNPSLGNPSGSPF
ncbi:hypothetical protein D0Y65_047202 [Glycine soja]|uniref:Uncharacterized protein n=1 Tax=Glycine soja TaxID=3848 RepID=A0A445FMN5_GLYSO|nr:hypothetical protein D0Y65_047202 [Glycine soja]